MSDLRLQMLDRRLSQIEKIVIGDKESAFKDTDCLESLYKFQKNFTKATEKREKITRMLNRVKEIEKYMDPMFLDDMALSNEAKIEIILSEEDKLRETSKLLERVYALNEVINSPQLKNIDSLQEKFSKLAEKHAEQKEQSEEVCAEARDLLQTYSNTIVQLDKLYTQWQQKLADVEQPSK